MAYRLPSKEEVEHAIAAVLRREKKLPSESRFLSLVRRELKRKDKEYTISHERLRRVALCSGLCRVIIHTREVPTRRPMARCPVCNTRVRPVKNETIYGGTVTLGYECPFCGYWTGMKRRVPQRYVFSSTEGGKRDVPAVRFMDMPEGD
jgi:uncharacterized protein with PIN domain